MSSSLRITFLATPLLAAACFNPTFDAPSCDPGGACPEGLMCIDGVCREEPVDPPDAMPGDDCDYEEANDGANNGAPEQTGLVIGAGATRMCGTLPDQAPDANMIIDTDFYQIDSGGQPVTARITLTGGNDYEEVLFALGGAVQTLSGAEASSTIQFANPTLQVAVQASNTGEIGHATDYVITVEPADPQDLCAEPGAASFAETLDTAANNQTGNNVLQGMLMGATLTPDIADVPEQPPASLDIQAGSRFKFVGTGFNVAKLGDMYKDRDTFVITTGAQTTSLTLALSWPEDGGTTADDADLDLFLYNEADLTIVFQGIGIGFGLYESGTVQVMPGTRYYAVVANYLDAQADKPYDLVICGP